MSVLFGPRRPAPTPDLTLLLYDLALSRRALLHTPDDEPDQLRALGLEAIRQAERALERHSQYASGSCQPG